MKTTKEQRQQVREQAVGYPGPHATCMKAAANLIDDLEEVEEHLLAALAFLYKGTQDGYAVYPLVSLSAPEIAKALGEDRVYVSPGGRGYVSLGESQRFYWLPIEQFSGARSVLVTKWGSGRVALAYQHEGSWQTGAGLLDFEPTHYGEVPTTPRHDNDPSTPEFPAPLTDDELVRRQGLFDVLKGFLEEDVSAESDSTSSPPHTSTEGARRLYEKMRLLLRAAPPPTFSVRKVLCTRTEKPLLPGVVEMEVIDIVDKLATKPRTEEDSAEVSDTTMTHVERSTT